ncbi:MAG: hypothetical protein QY331_00700 [Melioribacteraceae bacterium]|nr:hypothetical protein [Melioribacteraceae bacterium]WKZ69767.1 MAG: hypothetical protein QY331_00700 [Melioribacteraceae bacterium]
MKSITLHNMNNKLYQYLTRRAKEKGTSLNQTIKLILEEHFGIRSQQNKKGNEFQEFLGVWDKRELKQFQKRTEEFSKVNEDDWK